MSLVYHMVPRNFTGEILYSLNALKIHLPGIYETQVQKYAGREVLMHVKVPLLDCLWNDVLHLSPVHPTRIRDAFISTGFDWKSRPWFIIDPTTSGFSRDNTVIFLNTPPQDPGQFSDFDFPDTEFIPFSERRLSELTELPAATLNYLKFAKATGEKPFLFNYVPHVLYLGAIDVCGVEVVSY